MWLDVPADDAMIEYDQKEFDLLFETASDEILADNMYWTIDDFLGMRLGGNAEALDSLGT